MSSFLSRRFGEGRAWRCRCLLLASAMAVAFPAHAHEGYAQDVKDECAKAGRPVPTFSVLNCGICHDNPNNQRAYQSGDFLDVFCKVSNNPGGGGSATNTAPMLEHQPSPQTAAVGRPFRLTLAATDAEDDLLKFTAKKLPAGAKLGKTLRSNGKWTALMTWKPAKSQAGKTYTTQFVVTETRRKPKLSATQTVAFFVGAASAAARSLGIVQSRYESGVLTVSGTLAAASGSAAGPVVEVRRGNGEVLGVATADARGNWTVALPLPADRVPCEIRAVVGGDTLAVESVKTAQASCH